MQVRTYADVLDRIEALAGKDSFSTAEQTRLLSLVNARWFRAYRASEYWPRYIYVGESRVFDSSIGAIPFSQGSAVLVSGAGDENVNGIYQPIGTANGKPLYFLNGNDTPGETYGMRYSGTEWLLGAYTTEEGFEEDYFSDATASDPWTEPWNVGDSPAPVPTVTESPRVDIDSFMRLSSAAPYGSGTDTGQEVDFYVASDGAHPLCIPPSGFDMLWVTYKAEWGGPYAANTTAVPIEFFEYIAHGAFADWLRSTGQSLPQAEAEDGVAQEMLNYELLKSQSRANAQVNNQRFSTYISNQGRTSYSY